MQVVLSVLIKFIFKCNIQGFVNYVIPNSLFIRDGGKSCFSQSPVSGLSPVSRVKKPDFSGPII